ncbi:MULTISPECIES: YlqD family protein [Paraliobacillus]|uniref:YlqD family protein n=1 Tax=Paraliobacillus TaxID=200903 RepID=UPI000DD2BAD0|nr:MULTISPECIES: YlqD family protein [Paraliobacillus]
MQIIQKILVKQVITESSKTLIQKNFKKKLQQLEQESQQLIFERKKLEHKPGVDKYKVNKRFQDEIQKREERKKQIHFQLDQLEIVPIGTEIVENEVEALVDVYEGMNWQEVMKEQAIIIQDGMVIRID